MKKKFALFILLILMISVNSLADPLPKSEETAIRKVWEKFEIAYNSEDAEGISLLWSENGDLFSLSGGIFRGHKEIASFFAKSLSKNYKGSSFGLSIDQIRKVTKNIAIVDGTWQVTGDNLPKKYPTSGLYTQVLMQFNNKWLIIAARPSIPLKGHTRNHGRNNLSKKD